MNKIKKIIPIVLCIAILFTFKPFVNTTYAWWGIFDISSDPPQTGVNYGNLGANLAKLAKDAARWIVEDKGKLLEIIAKNKITYAKMIAISSVELATVLLVQGGDLGAELIIRDFDVYLFGATTQKALNEMNTFYNTVSKGRSSSLNYEGIGPSNYNKYLESQSRKDLDRLVNMEKYLEPTIQEQVDNPSEDLFSSGNMKGLMSYMECGNNVACFTLTANAKFKGEVEKNIEVAKIEQKDGILPQKINGLITKPSMLVTNALEELDNLGMSLIMTAEEKNGNYASAIWQINAGAALSTVSRLANYGLNSGSSTDASTVAQTSEYPFSLSYGDLDDCTNLSVSNKVNSAIKSVTTY